MAAPVRAELAAGPAAAAVAVHLLPCRVGHDGPAAVSAFFRPQAGPGPALWASFRGRRLGGLELPLPHGYRGLVLAEGPNDAQGRRLQVTGTFRTVTAWEADAAPSPAEGLPLALVWAPLAQAIHAPVSHDSDEEAEP
ncbi:ribonuclease H2 subunit C isoform X4 [Struthio camelus]|uniref:ribonuclease H2 subunit C isoform X4 n=1 Tax=Struthio camelus TaxID=8801 RepID=UPI003603CF95